MPAASSALKGTVSTRMFVPAVSRSAMSRVSIWREDVLGPKPDAATVLVAVQQDHPRPSVRTPDDARERRSGDRSDTAVAAMMIELYSRYSSSSDGTRAVIRSPQ
jgi:hypothetical protein